MLGRSRILTRTYRHIPSIRNARRPFIWDAMSSVSPYIQSGMIGLQGATGLPWWATFCASTFLVKLGLFPLIRSQILATRRVIEALPEMNFLLKLLQNKLRPLKYYEVDKMLRVWITFMRGINACLTINSASFAAVIVYPVTNMSFFFMFVYSLRDMVHGDLRQTLQYGGILWFEDLSTKDMTYVLPLAAICLSYLTIEVSLGNQAKSRLVVILKDLFQSAVICTIPVVTHVPAGVFMYWISSSLFAIGQTLLLRHPPFLKLLRIPTIMKPPPKVLNHMSRETKERL